MKVYSFGEPSLNMKALTLILSDIRVLSSNKDSKLFSFARINCNEIVKLGGLKDII